MELLRYIHMFTAIIWSIIANWIVELTPNNIFLRCQVTISCEILWVQVQKTGLLYGVFLLSIPFLCRPQVFLNRFSPNDSSSESSEESLHK